MSIHFWAQITGCKPEHPGDKANCLQSPGDIGISTLSLSDGGTNFANLLITIAAILSVIFLVMGGIRYITSNGDPTKLNQAKQTLTYAIIGLIIAIMARLIVGFVLTNSPK
jgi:FtsH-binding integral membrane protein